MTECIAQLRLSFYQPQPVEVTFDAPEISSNGGAILLRQVDDQLGLSAWFAAAIPEQRVATQTTHDRREQVRQRNTRRVSNFLSLLRRAIEIATGYVGWRLYTRAAPPSGQFSNTSKPPPGTPGKLQPPSPKQQQPPPVDY
jgi:Transposase DDE domain group 1